MPLTFCESSLSVWRFSVGIRNTIEELTSKVFKVSCFTVKFEVPAGPAPERQHYRGFDFLGRWGPQSGRVGQKGRGKTRHFRSKGCFFPGREAGCLSRARNPIEEWKHREASGRGKRGNLREIGACHFWNSQHSRGWGASNRARRGNSRKI